MIVVEIVDVVDIGTVSLLAAAGVCVDFVENGVVHLAVVDNFVGEVYTAVADSAERNVDSFADFFGDRCTVGGVVDFGVVSAVVDLVVVLAPEIVDGTVVENVALVLIAVDSLQTDAGVLAAVGFLAVGFVGVLVHIVTALVATCDDFRILFPFDPMCKR